jgi:1-acyl-sn-glycerol-3-phosphate acyltransferase
LRGSPTSTRSGCQAETEVDDVTQVELDAPVYRPNRVRLVRAFLMLVTRVLFVVRVEGTENLARRPAIYCANHLNWTDPLVMLAVMPARPKLAMFGPKEADMTVGARNRLITWAGFGIPYRPAKTDLLETTRRVQHAIAGGWAMLIMGEGRIHRGERELAPLADGSAYFALRTGVPVIPVAINGTSWLGFRRRIRVRIGTPIPAEGRATREAVDALTTRTADALLDMVADFPDPGRPGPFGRWLTEVFNDWPEGARPELGEGDAAGTAR